LEKDPSVTNRWNVFAALLVLLAAASLSSSAGDSTASLILPGERHFAAMRQLTFGGENAEGYFSFGESKLIFQSTRDSFKCDQMFTMDLRSLDTRLVSTGVGRTTCGYFFPGDSVVLFASTHASGPGCPPTPDFSHGYTWAVYPEYDIYTARADGANLRLLTSSPGYDAEATISPKGDRIVFTSSRNGDLDLYSMNLDGSDVHQLTNELGYDGGAFYSWDGASIVYRAWHYTDSKEADAYRELLRQHLVRPTRMELFIMNADGSNKRQITNNGAANFAPFFHPDNKRIIFASNMGDPKGRNFDLYLVNIDGTGLERITTNETFDGFPMFTRDGKRLVFASNRHGKVRGETNLFMVEWKD
jgi:Tol biopolymer transport system component